MIEVHLYGKLRRYADSQDPTSVSVASVEWRGGDTVGAVIARLEIPVEQVGSNVFLNGRYANSDSPIHDGDRLGLFPDDMQLLYKWYFAPQDAAGAPSSSSGAPGQVPEGKKPSEEQRRLASRKPEESEK